MCSCVCISMSCCCYQPLSGVLLLASEDFVVLGSGIMDDQKHFPSTHLLANDTGNEHQGGGQLNMTL